MKKIIRLTESDLERIVNRVIKENEHISFGDEESLDQYLEIPGKITEANWDVYDENHPNEKIRKIFVEFDDAKFKHSNDIRRIINKVTKLEKTPEVERYLNELHKYYETINDVPANLFENIELKSSL
jgi:hypothetical protein